MSLLQAVKDKIRKHQIEKAADAAALAHQRKAQEGEARKRWAERMVREENKERYAPSRGHGMRGLGERLSALNSGGGSGGGMRGLERFEKTAGGAAGLASFEKNVGSILGGRGEVMRRRVKKAPRMVMVGGKRYYRGG